MADADVVATLVGASRRSPTRVLFRVPPGFGASYADVAGDFSAWVPLAMERGNDGGFQLELRLDAGRRWRYRFLIDGTSWMNDPHAPEFVPGLNGGQISILVT